ncbi:DUF4331 family protein [Sinomonas sp. P10A9]|uniref:DUF4331 family protein n=1 Tax=Sinomonas puerhi TaxID=3238584 RepID=A0AB39L4D5_9MICC
MHHNDLPEGDPRHDITDLFVFQSSEDRARTAVILNVHPELTPAADPVDARVSYELKFDLDGDLEADLAFHILFNRAGDGRWGASVLRSTGLDARGTGRIGASLFHGVAVSDGHLADIAEEQGHRLFAGPRSDPFFADRDGFANGMQWTGRDYFADKDVFSIALEIPNDSLAGERRIAVWARTVGLSSQHVLNQAGRPGNNVFRPEPEVFQTVGPAQQREHYLDRYAQNFRAMGYTEAEAMGLAKDWVPDVLSYDCTESAGFPNGRRPTDDVVATAVEILTRAPLPASARIPAHSDLLQRFPYLGAPHHL